MLPMGRDGVTKLTSDAPNLLPKSYIDRIYNSCEPSVGGLFQINDEKSFARLKEIFPKFALKASASAGLYGKRIKVTETDEDKGTEISTYHLEDESWRLKADCRLVEPISTFADNVFVYKTPSNTTAMEKLKIYSTNKNEMAMKHLDLDSICKQGNWDSWREFFEARNVKGDKLKLLMGLIWAIYDDSYKTRQMIYWYDPNGYSGKSVALQALATPLVQIDAYGVYNESTANNFTNERLWDKRMLVVPDNKNPKLVKYGRFHQLTGGDAIDVDTKYRKGFTVQDRKSVV